MAELGRKIEFYSGGDPVATRVIINEHPSKRDSIITFIIQYLKLVAGVGFEPTTFRL